jgi:hypothetical protein
MVITSDTTVVSKSVTVSVYEISEVIFVMVGLATVVELKKVPGDHEYLYGAVPPMALGVPPIVRLLFMQVVMFDPAFAVNCA